MIGVQLFEDKQRLFFLQNSFPELSVELIANFFDAVDKLICLVYLLLYEVSLLLVYFFEKTCHLEHVELLSTSDILLCLQQMTFEAGNQFLNLLLANVKRIYPWQEVISYKEE